MTKNLPVAIALSPEAGLSTYIRTVNNLPMLSADEERALAVRFQDQDDLEAARQLVMSQLRFVVKIARNLSGYGLPQADLIQEGNIGLMKAVKSFDPKQGVRLVSFAVHWIKAEIYDYILRNWRSVKVATTKAQRKLFFNLRKSRARLGWMTETEIDTLARQLDVKSETVKEMELRMSGGDVAFDVDQDDDDDHVHPAPASYLQDMRYNPEAALTEKDQANEQEGQLRQALASLDERSRDIIQRRWLNEDNKPTLHELADEYGVSAERIRQIEKKALGSMKHVLVA
jgi:RNA polymerase sigma-32 factor